MKVLLYGTGMLAVVLGLIADAWLIIMMVGQLGG